MIQASARFAMSSCGSDESDRGMGSACLRTPHYGTSLRMDFKDVVVIVISEDRQRAATLENATFWRG
eukprot:4464945-Pleurochrysis_carterae.AAC.3